MKVLLQSGKSGGYDLMLDANGQLAFAEGKEAYAQIVSNVIRLVKGEYPLDVNRGIPYFDTVFSSVGYVNEWKSAVVAAISDLDFVQSVGEIDAKFDLPSRTMTYSVTVQTVDGESVTVTS